MKKLHLLTLIAALAFASAAHAQNFTGGIAVGGSGTYSASDLSFTVSSTEIYEGGNGTFAPLGFGLVSALNTSVSGFTGVGNALNLPAAMQPTFLISSTTTPANEYAFDITSITPEATAGVYQGLGKFVDNTGTLTTTDADFILSFAGGPGQSDGYSFSAAATPEPSSWALGLIALGSVFYLRRRALRA